MQAIAINAAKQAAYMRRVLTEKDAGLELCQCQEMRKANHWVDYCVAECGVGAGSLERQTFQTWAEVLNPGCSEAFREVQRMIEGGLRKWILLFGDKGLGKTHLLIAATGYLARAGKNVRYVTAPTLYESLIAAIKDNTYVIHMEALKRQPILVVDDLGAERATDFAREIMHSILDYRYQERLTTILATNAPSPDAFPPRLASRLSDMSLVEHIYMKGLDVRPRL